MEEHPNVGVINFNNALLFDYNIPVLNMSLYRKGSYMYHFKFESDVIEIPIKHLLCGYTVAESVMQTGADISDKFDLRLLLCTILGYDSILFFELSSIIIIIFFGGCSYKKKSVVNLCYICGVIKQNQSEVGQIQFSFS